jgi:acetolactate decarboxylase
MKKQINRILILILAIFLLQSCSSSTKQSGELDNAITQVATIDALLAGVYDGHITLEKMLEYGDFGLGTFDKLDGEMLVLDKIVYQIKADGKVYIPNDTLKTPFAAVSNFDAAVEYSLNTDIDLDSLKGYLDKQISNRNQFFGIKITGTFKYMKTRSVPAQEKPYPKLADVVPHQSIFDMEYIAGTIVGYFCPDFVEGINVPGYHLHFISNDFSQGGHILGLTTNDGIIELDSYNEFSLILPENNNDFNNTDLNEDRTDDLDDVEQE